jgi:hypothetical protein
MSVEDAAAEFARSEFVKMNLRCAVRAFRDPRYCGIGGFSTPSKVIEILRALGFIQFRLPGEWIGTEAGAAAIDQLDA